MIQDPNYKPGLGVCVIMANNFSNPAARFCNTAPNSYTEQRFSMSETIKKANGN